MDTGWRIYLIEGTYAERISTRLNPAALPLGYIYPIFIFTTFAQILFLSFFLDTKVYGLAVMQSVWEWQWHALSLFDSVSIDNLWVLDFVQSITHNGIYLVLSNFPSGFCHPNTALKVAAC